LSNCWMDLVVLRRLPPRRKGLQGDALFGLVLRAAPLFKQHAVRGKKASLEKHISSILRLSWLCKGRRLWREGGMDECILILHGHSCRCQGSVARERRERERERVSMLSGY